MYLPIGLCGPPNCLQSKEFHESQSGLAIGLAVFMAHCVLIPIDGCSINPSHAPLVPEPGTALLVGEPVVAGKATETDHDDQGPSFWRGMWIFWIGPLVGACLAAAVYKLMLKLDKLDGAAEEVQEKAEKESRPLDV